MSIYLTMFDNEGFDGLVNISEIEQQQFLDKLSSDDILNTNKVNEVYTIMKLRARMNSQRNPEIWSFNVSDDIDHQDILTMAEESPQTLADFVRENGTMHLETGQRTKQRII